mmetsp:Transcript_55070/g.143308  ORF Transcript_55070/g.143308 Transcript_55070/m.143308 type:complete len:211 (-) Transcript_55070:116-748(-)
MCSSPSCVTEIWSLAYANSAKLVNILFVCCVDWVDWSNMAQIFILELWSSSSNAFRCSNLNFCRPLAATPPERIASTGNSASRSITGLKKMCVSSMRSLTNLSIFNTRLQDFPQVMRWAFRIFKVSMSITTMRQSFSIQSELSTSDLPQIRLRPNPGKSTSTTEMPALYSGYASFAHVHEDVSLPPKSWHSSATGPAMAVSAVAWPERLD